MSNAPVASYDNINLFQNRQVKVGNRGYAGTRSSLSTNLSNATNNDLTITARDPDFENGPILSVQYKVIGNNAPAWLFEDGTPAVLVPATNLGFQIMSVLPGTVGNNISLTLINPGKVSSLYVHVPSLNDIVITLAHNLTVVTSTASDLVSLINSDPELSQVVVAYISDSSISTALPAVTKSYFKGGLDVPGLILVSLKNTNGTVSSIGSDVLKILNGSRYVTAVNKAANDGTGLVAALAATPLTGGSQSRGAISGIISSDRNWDRVKRASGNPMGKETNRSLQIRSTRTGYLRTSERVPKQDKATLASSRINYQEERGPKEMSWF